MRTSVRVSRLGVIAGAGVSVLQKERSAADGFAVRGELRLNETIPFEEGTEEIFEN